MVNLPALITKFKGTNHETDEAFFCTHVPWVAPEAYLNVIFKSAPSDLLLEVGAKMKIPAPFLEFLAHHNGAMLFSDALSLYGVVRQGRLLRRTDPFSLPPYNIESENRSWPPPDRERFLKIGSYGFDGSGICIDRETLEIVVFRRRETEAFAHWPSLDEWLNEELHRMSDLFDSSGKRLTDERQTLPSAKGSA